MYNYVCCTTKYRNGCQKVNQNWIHFLDKTYQGIITAIADQDKRIKWLEKLIESENETETESLYSDDDEVHDKNNSSFNQKEQSLINIFERFINDSTQRRLVFINSLTDLKLKLFAKFVVNLSQDKYNISNNDLDVLDSHTLLGHAIGDNYKNMEALKSTLSIYHDTLPIIARVFLNIVRELQ